MGFRITTWNVNGIRNPFGYQPWRDKRTFEEMFDILESDIVIMQETKIQRKDLRDDMVLVPGWDVFFSLPKHKKGYSGVAIYTRNSTCAPMRAEEGITGCLHAPKSTTSFRDLPPDQQIGGYPLPGQLSGVVDEATLDSEGRCVILEFPAFVLLGVYSPVHRDESRNDFRMGYLEALDVRIRNLVAAGKQVVLTGDLNVARSVLDSTNLVENLRKEGLSLDDWMSTPSRRLFNQLIFEGSVIGNQDDTRQEPVLWDLCRCFHPTREGMNTCWDTKRNTRPANIGSRIDYVLCSDGIKDWFTHADIQEGLHGSDHCPVFATTSDSVGAGLPILDLVNPLGMFKNGVRQREWSIKDLLPLSARLIPEFNRRQSIRDMFTKRSATSVPSVTPSTPSLAPWSAAPSLFVSPSSQLLCTTSKGIHVSCGTTTPLVGAESAERGQEDGSQPNRNSTNRNVQDMTCTEDPEPPRRNMDATTIAKPPTKRKLVVDSNIGSSKSNNSGSSSNTASKTRAPPGQRTLQGFFKPKNTTTATSSSSSSTPSAHTHSTKPPITNTAAAAPPVRTKRSTEAGTTHNRSSSEGVSDAVSPDPVDVPKTAESDKVFDPIQAKESWSKLLGKRVVPRCETHNEPCISLITKKPGMNCGRSFYICPRPLGPSGDKEKASEWRCGTFIWSSDWNGSST